LTRFRLRNLSHAYLGEADLHNASFSFAHLDCAYLGGTPRPRQSYGAHPDQAKNLEGAHLNDADLGVIHLNSAILSGAHLDDAGLRWETSTTQSFSGLT
jgi:uncharacterized protein YjbI with pentapeptide repeats